MPDDREALDTNLARLLRSAYRPVAPSEAFERRLLAALAWRQTRRERSARTLPPRALAAAALFLIAALVWVIYDPDAPRAGGAIADAGSGAGFFRLPAADGAPWARAPGRIPIARGDWLATDAGGGARIFAGDGAEPALELGSNSLLRWDEPPVLAAGSGTVHGAGGAVRAIETPLARIDSTGAVFRIVVEREENAPPIFGESGPAMKKSLIGGALAAGVVLVTIYVMQNADDAPVTVTTKGRVEELHAGDTARVAPGGEVEVAAGSTARGEGAGAAAPGAADGAETSEKAAGAADKGALFGRVVAREGEPVRGARVQFHVAADTSAAAIAPATTDEEGAFQLAIPAEVGYGLIEVNCDRFVTGRHEWRRAGELAEEEEGGEAKATAAAAAAEGAAPSADSAAPAAAARSTGDASEEIVIQLVHETAIAGVVADAESAPLENFMIGVQRIEPSHDWYEPDILNYPAAESGLETGAFYHGGLEPGNYHVWAYAHGSFRSDPVIVPLAEGELRYDLAFTLKPGHTIAGAVYAKRDGRAVQGAVVYAPLRHLPGSVNTIQRTEVDPRVRDAAKSDDKGRYELKDLAPGTYALRVLHPDYRPLDHTVTFAEGETPAQLEFALEEGTGIRGQVMDEKGEPMAGATVMAFTMTLGERELAEGLMTQVGADGHYYLRNMNPAQYIVLRMRDLEAASEAPKVTMATLGPREDAVVDFIEVAQLATLRGRVLDEKGEPLPRIGVTASTVSRSDFSFLNALTDDDGRFEIRNLQLKPYSIGLSKEYSMNMAIVESIVFDRATDYDREFVFHDLRISGIITAARDGEPVRNSEMYVLALKSARAGAGGGGTSRGATGGDGEDDDYDFAGLIYTDDTGHYRIAGLAPGKYVLLPNAPGYLRAPSEPVELGTETLREGTIDMKLVAGFAVEVEVVGREGAAIAGAVVVLRDARNREVNQGLPPRTDAKGVYAFSNLEAGTYTAEVMVEDAAPVTATFQTTPDGPARVRVEVDAAN